MQILVVSQHFWPSVGGAEVQLRRLAAQWTRSGHLVDVLTCRWERDWKRVETLDDFSIFRLDVSRTRFWGTLRFVRALSGWIRFYSAFDVVYVSMLKHAAFAAAKSCRQNGLPLVLRAEGAGPTGDIAWQQSALFGSWIRRRCKRANGFVVPSLQIREEMLSAGYPADHIRVIPNGVPIPEPPWRREDLAANRQALGLPDRPTVCYTGRLHLDKGLDDLVRAVPSIVSESGPVQLVIVGEGPHLDSLVTLSRSLEIEQRVRFIGPVGNVEPYLRASDLYVLPSYQEGLSVALLEALALGIPAIASDIPANRGIVSDNHLPLFPIRDPQFLAAAISERLLESTWREKLRLEARTAITEHFAIEQAARQHLELFERLVLERNIKRS